MPAGTCVPHGTSFCQYLDNTARNTSTGVSRFKMSFTHRKLWLTAYGDLSKATETMTVEVESNHIASTVTGHFRRTRSGWVLDNHSY